MINTYIALNKRTIYGSFAFPAAIFLITEIVYAVMLGIFKEDSTFLFLSAALPIGTAAYMAILLMYHSYSLFEQSVKMGRTRKETIPAILGYDLLFGVTLVAFAELLALVDIIIVYKVWGAFIPNLFIFGRGLIIPIWGVALMAVGAPLLGFAFAGLMHRFNKGAFWVIWGCWMLMVFFPSAGTPVINFIERNYIILPIAGIILFIWSLFYFRKAPVKN